MVVPRFRAIIERVDGKNKSRMTDPVRFSMFLATLKPGDTVWFDAITKKPKRSDQQNRYYWVYLSIIAEETGDTENDLHEFFKRKLLPPVFITVRGETIRIPASTKKLSKGEMSEYLMKIAALTGIPLPDIEEAGYIRN